MYVKLVQWINKRIKWISFFLTGSLVLIGLYGVSGATIFAQTFPAQGLIFSNGDWSTSQPCLVQVETQFIPDAGGSINSGISCGLLSGNIFTDSFYSAWHTSVSGTLTYYMDGGDNPVIFQVHINSSGQIDSGAVSSSQIISVTPSNGSIVATTTTVGVTGYLASADLSSTTELSIQLNNAGCSASSVSVLDAVDNTCSLIYSVPLTSSGSFSFSTSTTFGFGGTWTQSSSILIDQSSGYCLFGYCVGGSSQSLAATSTSFSVGGQNALDVITNLASSTNIFTLSSASSTVACNPFSGQFDVFGCVSVLTVPNSEQVSLLFQQAENGFLDRFPFGYITRAILILNMSGTSTLPSLSFTVPAGLNVGGGMTGMTFDLSPWGLLDGPGSMLSTATSTFTGTGFNDVFVPWFDDLVYLLFGFAVFHAILGFIPQHSVTESGSEVIGSSTYDPKTGKRIQRSTRRFDNTRY